MNTTSQLISYSNTGFFLKIIVDCISSEQSLKPFYSFATNIEGINKSIEQRKKYPTNRKALVEVLQKQYTKFTLTDKQKFNIQQLNNENCFTITTAHQPNIFTGHLYFIYKILHAVKLCEALKKQLPENNFVPIYYMGSEDADFDELGHVFIDGKKYEWKTNQTGAVGRMKIDKELVKLIDAIAGQVLIHPFGKQIIDAVNECYKIGVSIEQATFEFVNYLFKDYGVLVVLPDDAALKKLFIPIVKNELTEAFSHKEVAATVAAFPKEYKVQASGRELNLFYLKDDSRERIEVQSAKYIVINTSISFSKEEIIAELHNHPERFSPNVILRPVFQEMILPNIAFVGGGGEIAYWLQLKKVFNAVHIPYPVLVLRNSFLFVEKKYTEQAKKLGISITDLFKEEQYLLNEIVKRESKLQLNLNEEKKLLADTYEKFKTVTDKIDITLTKHTNALQTQALKKITALENKMLKAEKKKFEAQQRQLHKLKNALFPNNNLQERVENIIPFYAKWGNDFIKTIYYDSLGLQQEFVVLSEVE